MKKFKEWSKKYSESIAHLSEGAKNFLMQEDPHFRINAISDPSLKFLVGVITDFGLENLNLSEELRKQYRDAMYGAGTVLTGTLYKIRYTGVMMKGVIEVATGQELELPRNWRQAVLVVNHQDQFSWIGKLVRPDQLGVDTLSDFDFTVYRETEDGWELI